MRISITKKEALKILKRMQKISNKNPLLKGFYVKSVKNGRGDYGYDDEYFYNRRLFFIFSIDGARSNAIYYKTIYTEEVLKEIEEIA